MIKHKFALLLLILSAFFVVAPKSVAEAKNIYAYNQRYISLQSFAKTYKLKLKRTRDGVTISSLTGNLTLRTGKYFGEFNGRKVYLSFPLYFSGNYPYISSIDANSLVIPLLLPKSVPKQKVLVVFLDPGHGGKDNGAASGPLKEKAFNLQIAKKVEAILKKNNCRVIMSRSNDKQLSLASRVNAATKAKASIFVSIHANAAKDKSVAGIETFCLTPAGAASSNAAGGTTVATKYSGNEFDRNNISLADAIHRSLLGSTKAVDRGIKRARFQVIRDVTCPAVLIECGFVSNTAEAKKLGSATYQDLLARGIANGILAYKKQMQ